mgnify:CR=1 FL=1
MNWTENCIPLHLHPLGFIDAFTQLGAKLDTFLNDTGIKQQDLKTVDGKISYQTFMELIHSGLTQCKQPGLGLLVSEHFKWFYHGVTGMAINASSTFNQAGLAFQRYSCIAQPYYMPFRCTPFYYLNNRLQAIIPIEHFITTKHMDESFHRFELEFRIGLLFNILKQFGGRHSIENSTLELNIGPPTEQNTYEELSFKNIKYNCTHSRLITPVTEIDTEGNLLSKGIYKQSLEYCNQELRKVTQGAPNVEHVRTLLVENLPNYPNINSVAKRMGLTTRTLARKLKLEGTSFTDTLNTIRSEIAIYLLGSTHLSIDDISESLGFTETTNFRHAFQKWTGQSSSAFR